MTRQRNWDYQAISTFSITSTLRATSSATAKQTASSNRSRRRTRARSVLASYAVMLAMLLGCAVLWLPGSAQAAPAMHEITWSHNAAGDVANFVVFVSAVEGDQANSRLIDVGKPESQPGSGTLQTFSAIVSVELDEYVAVAAIAVDGSLSGLSAWSTLPPSQPGQPLLIP